jgi:hypothetical protein
MRDVQVVEGYMDISEHGVEYDIYLVVECLIRVALASQDISLTLQ